MLKANIYFIHQKNHPLFKKTLLSRYNFINRNLSVHLMDRQSIKNRSRKGKMKNSANGVDKMTEAQKDKDTPVLYTLQVKLCLVLN